MRVRALLLLLLAASGEQGAKFCSLGGPCSACWRLALLASQGAGCKEPWRRQPWLRSPRHCGRRSARRPTSAPPLPPAAALRGLLRGPPCPLTLPTAYGRTLLAEDVATASGPDAAAIASAVDTAGPAEDTGAAAGGDAATGGTADAAAAATDSTAADSGAADSGAADSGAAAPEIKVRPSSGAGWRRSAAAAGGGASTGMGDLRACASPCCSADHNAPLPCFIMNLARAPCTADGVPQGGRSQVLHRPVLCRRPGWRLLLRCLLQRRRLRGL